MPLRAAAFHQSVSVARLEQLFNLGANILFAGTVAVQCSHCPARFAIFLPDKDNPDNAVDVTMIQERINQDCHDGHHAAEIVVNR
jgi:hypothetical protein